MDVGILVGAGEGHLGCLCLGLLYPPVPLAFLADLLSLLLEDLLSLSLEDLGCLPGLPVLLCFDGLCFRLRCCWLKLGRPRTRTCRWWYPSAGCTDVDDWNGHAAPILISAIPRRTIMVDGCLMVYCVQLANKPGGMNSPRFDQGAHKQTHIS